MVSCVNIAIELVYLSGPFICSPMHHLASLFMNQLCMSSVHISYVISGFLKFYAEMLAKNQAKKECQGIFSSCFFQKLCFINSQSLTACQK